MQFLLLGLLVLLVLVAPEGLEGLGGTISTESEVQETENADGGDDVEQNVGGGLVSLRDVVFDDVVAAVPSVERDGKGEDQVDGEVEERGREEQANGHGDGQSPSRELEDLVLHILGGSNSLRRHGPSTVGESARRAYS